MENKLVEEALLVEAGLTFENLKGYAVALTKDEKNHLEAKITTLLL